MNNRKALAEEVNEFSMDLSQDNELITNDRGNGTAKKKDNSGQSNTIMQ